MQLTMMKEDISISYISAVCASAGIAYDIKRHDADSTDGILAKKIDVQGAVFNAELRVQLKSTSSVSQYTDKEDSIIYTLKAKNYNDLCENGTSQIILCLLILPEDEDWINWTESELMIKGCMYWMSFSGRRKTKNKNTINVSIPKINVVNKDTLNELLEKIAREEEL